MGCDGEGIELGKWMKMKGPLVDSTSGLRLYLCIPFLNDTVSLYSTNVEVVVFKGSLQVAFVAVCVGFDDAEGI